MRRFKFVGTEKESFDYNRLSESGRPVYGTVYNETDMIYGGSNVLHWAEHSKFSHEWQEVFDTLEDKITELKELAKSQGMDCEVVLKEANIWDGVEFAQYGKTLLKVNEIVEGTIFSSYGNRFSLSDCQPSTESAYVEQLKKKAFEMFGEIKEGDMFEKDFGFYGDFKIGDIKDYWGFKYRKGNDTLMYRGLTIYEAGKWATKVNKKLEVIASGYDVNHYPNHSCFQVEFFIYNDNIRDYSNKEIANFLAKQLETYLNENK